MKIYDADNALNVDVVVASLFRVTLLAENLELVKFYLPRYVDNG